MNTANAIRYNWFAGVLAFFLPVLLLMGCSTTPPPKPQEVAMQPQQRPAIAKPAKEAASSSGSSLEALREGKPPASGPLKDIYFDFDRYDLSAVARDTLKDHAEWLKGKPSAQVEIEGHCDERGTGEYNLALGAKRAQASKDYLVTLGVAAARITTVSYGKELPVCSEHTEDCWQRNRHDRFVVKNVPLSAGTF
jgi:peptidoglycan-associated lipoprotein